MQRIIWLCLLASLTLAAYAQAQVPQPPAGGVPPAAVPAAAPAAAPKNIWSCLFPSADQLASCRDCFCKSCVGQLASGAMGPVTAMSGGLVQNHCAALAITNVLNDPNKAPGGAEKTAAAIKKDEAEMQARREAVRYLGTVDCSRWPEAEKALIEALLYDRSECVRFEAALALQRGCCCTKLVVKALTDCVTGISKPAEKSERVKVAAMQALSHCVLPPEPVDIKDKEKEKDKKVALTQADYCQQVQEMPQADVMAQARKALAEGQAGSSVSTSSSASRPGSVAQIFTNAFNGPKIVAHAGPASAPGQQASPSDPVTAAGERKPFFDGLTKALKGPQTASQPAAPAPVVAAVAPPPATIPASVPTPVPVTVTVDAPSPAPVVPQTVVVTQEAEALEPGHLPMTVPNQQGQLPMGHPPAGDASMLPLGLPALPGVPPSTPQP